jgi:hypothetical protein
MSSKIHYLIHRLSEINDMLNDIFLEVILQNKESSMALTIYDLPDSVNSDYARRQAEYDAERAAGRVTPTGVVEAAAYQATRIRAVEVQPPQLDMLLGTNIQSRIALFLPLTEIEMMRGFTTRGTPSLGTVSRREADKAHIRDVLSALGPEDRAENLRAGEALIAVIDQTISWDHMANDILGQMGSLTAG